MQDDGFEVTLIELLHRSLLRARAEAQRWQVASVRSVEVGAVVVLALFAASLTPMLRAMVLAIPFYVIFGACQLTRLDSRARLSRIEVRALEERINRSLGGSLFVSNLLDAAHDDPPEAGSILGVSLANPGAFRSIYALHVGLGSIVVFVLATYRSLQIVPEMAIEFPPILRYPILLAAWAAVHLVVFVWYRGSSFPEKRATAVARDAYGIGEPSVESQIFGGDKPGA